MSDSKQADIRQSNQFPNKRRLKVFTFDPSLATQMETRTICQATIELPWEDLKVGPVGEYVSVVDVDPASGVAYAPVDLNSTYALAQDGLEPSLGNPQFHQQMVYAVTMKTIRAFELSLGRPVFWKAINPREEDADKAEKRVWPNGEVNNRDQFVQHLRLYPHAIREPNAYYHPDKRAILFGYFRAVEDSPGEVYPGGMVFTCLSHDIIAHETTHAILDGMHSAFSEPTNPDVFAFHEAFSDIVALLQHFTYPEVVRDQIAKTRGDLNTQNLMLQLAQEFGRATGGHHALRDAIGGLVATSGDEIAKTGSKGYFKKEVSKVVIGPAGPYERSEEKRVYRRYEPDPTLLDRMDYAGEAHRRGSILVAAVFDAFLAIYETRTADLIRIATNGTGILPNGGLQTDLVNRIATEATKAAQHLLRICIRSVDYMPPVDITFGEFLRAMITADRDIAPDDPMGYRVAIIESFRKWGIYPRDVRVLAEETLAWHPEPTYLFDPDQTEPQGCAMIKHALENWGPGADRQAVFDSILEAQKELYLHLVEAARKEAANPIQSGRTVGKVILEAIGLLRDDQSGERWLLPKMGVSNLRPARRIDQNGDFITDMIFEVLSHADIDKSGKLVPRPEDEPKVANKEAVDRFTGAMTMVVDMKTWRIRYVIYKRLGSDNRLTRFNKYRASLRSQGFGTAEYSCPGAYEGNQEEDRKIVLEAIRADSCECCKAAKEKRQKKPRNPFAMIHRGMSDCCPNEQGEDR